MNNTAGDFVQLYQQMMDTFEPDFECMEVFQMDLKRGRVRMLSGSYCAHKADALLEVFLYLWRDLRQSETEDGKRYAFVSRELAGFEVSILIEERTKNKVLAKLHMAAAGESEEDE